MSAEVMSEAYGNRLGTMSVEDKKEEYDKGLGSMSAEAKSEAYTKELGSMSAEANSEAYDKGFGSMSAASSDKCEEQCAEFEAHDGMPVLGTKLHNWQKNQLSNRPTGLDARIEKEIATNEWGTDGVIGKGDSRVALRKSILLCAATSGRSSTQCSKHTWGCRQEEPSYIIGKRTS